MKFPANKPKINIQCTNYNGYVSPVKYIITNISIRNYMQYIISLKYTCRFKLQFTIILLFIIIKYLDTQVNYKV